MNMILAVAKNRLMNLKRDRAAFVLAFVLPVAFFTIFAGIFAGGGRATTRKIAVVVVDEDGSEGSRRFVAGLRAEAGLSVGMKPGPENDAAGPLYTAALAEQAVRKGEVPVALIIPRGFGQNAIAFGPAADRATLRILADTADPVAPQVLNGLIQKVAMTSMPSTMARSGMAEVDRWSGGLTPEQKARMEEAIGAIEKESSHGAPSASKGPGGLVAVETRDVLGVFRDEGFADAAEIGEITAGAPRVTVR